ncbi:MAG: carbohydrate binding domain-containing protein [Planctomycetota bacterium]|jgi:hypothetical protein
MSVSKVAVILGVAVLTAPSTSTARQNIAANGSMEAGLGQGGPNPRIPADWTEFGENVERSEEANHTAGGNHSLKAFGDGLNSLAGAFQEIAASPGETASVTAWLYTRSTDKLDGSGQAGIRLEFLDQFGGIISGHTVEAFVLDAGSPGDTWIEATLGPQVAPAQTTDVRLTCILTYVLGDISGSVYWDDIELSGTTGELLNGDIEIAGISTEPNPNGIDDWVGFEDQQKSDEAAFHGDWSVKVGTSVPYSGLFQDIGVLEAGDEVLLVARAMTPASDPINGTAQAGIKLEFDPVGTVPPPEENLAFDENATPDTWTQVTLQTTVPPDMTIAKIVCIYDPVFGGLTTGTVYFDVAEAKLNGGPNLLNNDSFESNLNPLTDWEAFLTAGTSVAEKSCFVSGITPVHGVCMLKTAGGAVAGVVQPIIVSPGDTLDVSAWLYTPSNNPLTGPGNAGVKVEWSPGNVPDDVDIGGPTNTIFAQNNPTPDVWHELTIEYTMPAGSEALGRFTNLVAKGTATQGTVYFDVCEAVVINRFAGRADGNADDDSDLADFASLQECFSGDGGTPVGWPCFVFDFNDDRDVDLGDFDPFEQGMTGPVPPP